MSNMAKCDKCGEQVGIADWPFCPHGSTKGAGLLVHTFRSYEDEHILPGPRPTLITSPGHRREIMKKEHLEIYAVGAGMPGCEV